MSSQQFPRHGMPGSTGGPQIPGVGNLVPVNQPNQQAGGDLEGGRDGDHTPQDHPPGGGGGALAFRDDKQETVVVRPYPQVQTHGQTQAPPQPIPIQSGAPVTVSAAPVNLPQGQPPTLTEGQVKLKSPMPSRLIAPAPASNQTHLSTPPKVPGNLTVTMESSITPTPPIPVATISGQQGQSSNLHQLMSTNIQIIRSGTSVQIGTSAVPPQTFTSHLPRGAAAAAVMSSSKTVLRPATGPNTGPGQPNVQHIIHQTIQSRPAVTTTTAVLPTVVAPISAPRTQPPVINSAVTHAAEMVHGRPGMPIHPPPATISIQRPQASRDPSTRITLPSHPALGAPKPQQPHAMTQKSIFSSMTPVAAATVAPIVATNTVPSTTTMGSAPHSQMTGNTIVTMTMASHSSHATAATTSAIPVAKVVPQPIAHTSPRVQPDYTGDRTNLIPIPGHRSSPSTVTMETRSDNRSSVPVQFQYFLPTYSSSSYHTYTPITSSVPTLRQYPVTPQAPSSALPTPAGVGVATTVHLNPMQLMAVDRIGLQSPQIGAQGLQPAAIAAQGLQPAPIGVQGLHTSASINTTQGLQQAPIVTQQQNQQPQMDAKPGMVLADGFVASTICSTFGATQPVATMVQAHTQGVGGAPTLASSPRPSILRKKPTNDGCVRKNLMSGEPNAGRLEGSVRGAGSPRPSGVKPKAEVHVAMAPPVMAAVEALPSQQGAELQQLQQQAVASSPAQHLSQALPTPGPPAPPSSSSSSCQPSAVLSAMMPANMAASPPVPASMANTVASPTQPAASSTPAGTLCPEVKVKQEAEPMDTSQPGPTASGAPGLAGQGSSAAGVPPPGELLTGASPRKKPRKQQHAISTEEMVETNSTDEERGAGRPPTGRAERRESPPREYVDEEGVRYVPVRPRPPVTLLRHYRNPWKAAYHHFQRYSDIRVKEEKKGSLQEMANQRGVACRAQGWKIHLCAAQLGQLSSLEHDVYSRLSGLQEGLMPKKRAAASDDDMHRINELIQGNMQRCKLVMDQVTEARDTMMKVLDHKDKVLKLLNKNGNAKKSSKLKRKERA